MPTRATGGGGSAIRRYQDLVVGEAGLWPLLRYELITGLAGPLPGALGLFLRSRLYRRLLGAAGRGMVIGRNVTLRGPRRIHLEPGVVLDDDVEMTARGDGSSIRIGAGTLVARGSILHARGGSIEIGPEGSIGTHCRFGTNGTIRIGRYGPPAVPPGGGPNRPTIPRCRWSPARRCRGAASPSVTMSGWGSGSRSWTA
jgi:hypothetical protein